MSTFVHSESLTEGVRLKNDKFSIDFKQWVLFIYNEPVVNYSFFFRFIHRGYLTFALYMTLLHKASNSLTFISAIDIDLMFVSYAAYKQPRSNDSVV